MPIRKLINQNKVLLLPQIKTAKQAQKITAKIIQHKKNNKILIKISKIVNFKDHLQQLLIQINNNKRLVDL